MRVVNRIAKRHMGHHVILLASCGKACAIRKGNRSVAVTLERSINKNLLSYLFVCLGTLGRIRFVKISARRVFFLKIKSCENLALPMGPAKYRNRDPQLPHATVRAD